MQFSRKTWKEVGQTVTIKFYVMKIGMLWKAPVFKNMSCRSLHLTSPYGQIKKDWRCHFVTLEKLHQLSDDWKFWLWNLGEHNVFLLLSHLDFADLLSLDFFVTSIWLGQNVLFHIQIFANSKKNGCSIIAQWFFLLMYS